MSYSLEAPYQFVGLVQSIQWLSREVAYTKSLWNCIYEIVLVDMNGSAFCL